MTCPRCSKSASLLFGMHIGGEEVCAPCYDAENCGPLPADVVRVTAAELQAEIVGVLQRPGRGVS